jgi:hypothetical protein
MEIRLSRVQSSSHLVDGRGLTFIEPGEDLRPETDIPAGYVPGAERRILHYRLQGLTLGHWFIFARNNGRGYISSNEAHQVNIRVTQRDMDNACSNKVIIIKSLSNF